MGAAFDEIALTYDETRGGDARGDRYAATLEQFLPRGGTLVELGVGTGIVAGALGRIGYEVVGVDVSSGMLAFARERLGSRVARGDIQAVPFRPGSAAGAYSIWVLHQFPDITVPLRAIRELLVPGGVFVNVSARNPIEGEEIAPILTRLFDQLTTAPSPDRPDLLTDAASSLGLEALGRAEIRHDTTWRPEEVADNVARRGFSILGDVDDAAWEAYVAPAVAELRALPDQERPRTRTTVHELVALTRAG